MQCSNGQKIDSIRVVALSISLNNKFQVNKGWIWEGADYVVYMYPSSSHTFILTILDLQSSEEICNCSLEIPNALQHHS